jgi:hypothetical protein
MTSVCLYNVSGTIVLISLVILACLVLVLHLYPPGPAETRGDTMIKLRKQSIRRDLLISLGFLVCPVLNIFPTQVFGSTRVLLFFSSTSMTCFSSYWVLILSCHTFLRSSLNSDTQVLHTCLRGCHCDHGSCWVFHTLPQLKSDFPNAGGCYLACLDLRSLVIFQGTHLCCPPVQISNGLFQSICLLAPHFIILRILVFLVMAILLKATSVTSLFQSAASVPSSCCSCFPCSFPFLLLLPLFLCYCFHLRTSP